MSTLNPEARALVRAIDSLTSQARRIADALTAGEQPAPTAAEAHTLADGTGAGFRAALAADEDQQRTTRRVSLRVLLNRVNRGLALTDDEAQLLARHVATEITDANDGRKRAAQAEELQRIAHETSNRSEAERAKAAAELEQARAAIARARALASRWAVLRTYGSAATELRAALEEPPAPAATEATEPARCCGKPEGAVCVHDVTTTEA